MEDELPSMYGEQGTDVIEDSREETLREMSYYVGPYEAQSDVVYLNSYRRTEMPKMDTHSLQDLMSTSVRCMLTLAELLKVKPQMWKDVGKCLKKMGVIALKEKLKKEMQDLEKPKQHSKPVPLNKVGEY